MPGEDACECALRADHGDADPCHATDGWAACTRPAGHDGPHSACTPAEHPATTWEADDA